MARGFEASNLSENCIHARPGQLLCACCMAGGAVCFPEEKAQVQSLQDAINRDQNVHIILKTAFDDAGARTELYHQLTPEQRKRDLDILHAMGETPETVRTAKIWTELLREYIPDCTSICAPYETQTGIWQNCPNAKEKYYSQGLAAICPPRDAKEKACAKSCSCQALADAKAVSVRAHHLMCMICVLGGPNPNEPLEEDNLVELWGKIRENPEIPITLLEGPGACVVCPPCYAFDPESRLCFVSCSLRDRKKDLDVFAKLGLQPGDTLSAREILRKIYQTIKTVEGICWFPQRRGFEWKNCVSIEDMSFAKGMETVAKDLGFDA